MGKVAADANALAKGLKSGAIGTSLQVVEAEMAVDEIANGFYTGPSSRRGAEGSPSKIKQLAVDFTISAWQHERERFDGDLSNVVLRRVGCVGVQFARITNDCIVEKTNHSPSGIDAAAVVTESVYVLLDRQFWLQAELFNADEVAFA
jgi:hypothetical protein